MLCRGFAVPGGVAVVTATGRVLDVRGECGDQHAGAGVADEHAENCKRNCGGSFTDFGNMGTRTIRQWADIVIHVAD